MSKKLCDIDDCGNEAYAVAEKLNENDETIGKKLVCRIHTDQLFIPSGRSANE